MAQLATIGRIALIWLALTMAQIVAGMILAPKVGELIDPGPVGSTQALLLVNAIYAPLLALFAARLSLPWRKKAALIFALVLAVATILSLIEAYFFGAFLHLPDNLYSSTALQGALHATAGALAAALLWRASAPAMALPMRNLAWTMPAVILLYMACYWAAGYFIAWQSEAVRGYYENGTGIDNLALLSLQVVRGAVWAALALTMLRSLTGSRFSRGIVIGTAFAVLMATPLFFPTDFMPWAVRRVHMVELLVSNFLFGFLACFILARPTPTGNLG